MQDFSPVVPTESSLMYSRVTDCILECGGGEYSGNCRLNHACPRIARACGEHCLAQEQCLLVQNCWGNFSEREDCLSICAVNETSKLLLQELKYCYEKTCRAGMERVLHFPLFIFGINHTFLFLGACQSIETVNTTEATANNYYFHCSFMSLSRLDYDEFAQIFQFDQDPLDTILERFDCKFNNQGRLGIFNLDGVFVPFPEHFGPILLLEARLDTNSLSRSFYEICLCHFAAQIYLRHVRKTFSF
jgi:hypothetical protein